MTDSTTNFDKLYQAAAEVQARANKRMTENHADGRMEAFNKWDDRRHRAEQFKDYINLRDKFTPPHEHR